MDPQNALLTNLLNFLDKRPIVSAQWPKIRKKRIEFWSKIFLEVDPLDTENEVLTTVPNMLCNPAELLSLNVKIRLGNLIFPATKHIFHKRSTIDLSFSRNTFWIFFQKLILYTLTLQFWQSWRKNSATRGRKFFAQCHKTFEKIFFWQKATFLSNEFLERVECIFENRVQCFFRQRALIFTLSGLKWEKKENSFWKDVSLENVPIDPNNAVLTTLPKSSCHLAKVF